MPEVGQRLDTVGRAPGALQPRLTAASTTTSFSFGAAHAGDRAAGEYPGRPRPPQAGRRRRRRFGLAVAVAASGAVATLLHGGALTDVFDRDRIATHLGFGIEQVSLTGHRFTADRELFDALDLRSARSLVSFDAEAVRRRFEILPWVQSAEITRIWPGQLAIRVTERQAFAIWERGEAAVLVDATGRVLGPVKRDAPLDLPRISGEGANALAGAVWSLLDRYPAVKSRVTRTVRVGERRWTLDLAGGGRIHLPTDGEASALARLAAEPQLLALVEAPGRIIDMRSPGRVAVRAAAPGPSSGAIDGSGM